MQTAKISALVFGFALVTAACGDSKSSLLPTAPSALSAGATNAGASTAGGEYGTMGNGPRPGNGNGNGNGNGGGNPSPNAPAPVPPGKSKVEIEGLISAVGGNSITVNNQVVGVTASTVIRHGNRRFELSELHEGDRVHVSANLVAATLEATEIRLQNPGDAPEPAPVPAPAPVPVTALVSVSAFDSSAMESPEDSGVFRLTRTVGDASQLTTALTVNFTMTGTAVNGSDYTLPLQATFAAGESMVDVTLTPANDGIAESMETATLTLTSVASYRLGSPQSATINVTDEPNPLVTVQTTDGTASEAGGQGRFMLTRTGSATGALTVTVEFGGSAVFGTDYRLFSVINGVVAELLSPAVTFAAGSATVTLIVAPFADAVSDPSETAMITVVAGEAYDLGLDITATCTISGT